MNLLLVIATADHLILLRVLLALLQACTLKTFQSDCQVSYWLLMICY